MSIQFLHDLLEDPGKAPFYDLLGGLADNLLSISSLAGSFLSCSYCGHTFTQKSQSWECERCHKKYEIKFERGDKAGTWFKAKLESSGLTKARLSPYHWYLENENWTVAEFLTQVLRLGPETFLAPWCEGLGMVLHKPAVLETHLCWPRFPFGGKTIQPDLALGFANDLVCFEFKRPGGAPMPPLEVMGHFGFAIKAAQQLNRRWHLVLIPGPDAKAGTAPDR
jgi:hypothetical protein